MSDHLLLDKDNDLRCRINKRAKTIYGKEYSQEKVDFLKAEFATRKAKRIVREKSKRKPSFTGYSMPQVVAAKHFPNASDEVNAAGILLVNTLHIIIHKNAAPSNHVAAFALKSAIDDQEIDNQPFVEALRLLGSDINIMSILSAPLNGQRRQAPTKSSNTLDYPSLPGIATPTTGSPSVGSARSELTPSIGDSTFPIEPRLRLRGGMVTETNGMSESDKILCALNTATEILGNMIEATALFYHPAFAQPTTGYVTPYANSYESPYKTPYPNPDSTQSTKANPSTLSNGLDHSARKSSSSDAMKSNILQHSIDQAKVKATFQVDQALGERAESNVVDDFLRLAGGGSLTDDDAESGTSAENRASRLDIDVEATLNHICKIMENRDSAGKLALEPIDGTRHVLLIYPGNQVRSCPKLFALPSLRLEYLRTLSSLYNKAMQCLGYITLSPIVHRASLDLGVHQFLNRMIQCCLYALVPPSCSTLVACFLINRRLAYLATLALRIQNRPAFLSPTTPAALSTTTPVANSLFNQSTLETRRRLLRFGLQLLYPVHILNLSCLQTCRRPLFLVGSVQLAVKPSKKLKRSETTDSHPCQAHVLG